MGAANQTPMVIGNRRNFLEQRPGETSLVELTRRPSGFEAVET